MTPFETVIGLEVHLQLKTRTKIFCGCRNEFGHQPNTNVCPVCLGLPGTLPVLNRQVLLDGVRVGLALHCAINNFVKFDRKNYFYPDLPKGYQISQFDLPIARQGYLDIVADGREKRVRITRAHLEEDAGKLIHDAAHHCSLVDYNRTGTPLVEIVSEPDLRSSVEAYEYLTALKLTLSYLGVSDCDMEKGSLRCDANVSIRPLGQSMLGTKTELKNLNSFSALKRAVDAEVARQTGILLAGGRIVQETLLWNDAQGTAAPMRSKEQAHDYRYFPEPDLVPFTLEEKQVQSLRESLPELPYVKLSRFMARYGLSRYDAFILVQDQGLASFFEECARISPDVKKVANWLIGPLMKEMNERKCAFDRIPLTPQAMAAIIQKVETSVISNIVGKEVLALVLDSGRGVDAIIEEKGLAQVSDDEALGKVVDDVIAAHPEAVAEIRGGKAGAIGFLVGQALKRMPGKANPKKINEILSRRLQDV